ncbi:MAG: ADP-ribosylglycohydrolase family protein [Nitrosomonas sp.]|nr:ADP-ribosylglycohydrolase family protein [Nitrosomonas sp.]
MNSNIKLNPNMAAIFGALISDSAALGLHWLYDTKRIAEIETNNGLVFLQPNAKNYADTKGFFAHANKLAGDSSGYGEICLLILQHMAKHGKFSRIEYQKEFCTHFGPGGKYIGYIDSPTRLTLRQLLPLTPEDYPAKSGADDDQFAALATIPVLVATHKGSQEALLELVEEVVTITNHNEVAVSAAQCIASVLFSVLNGDPLEQALTKVLPSAGDKLNPLLQESLGFKSLDSIKAAEKFGSACHVVEGLPTVFHIAQHTNDYKTAIESNIRAGGDSCGRGIMLGAIVAAYQAKQENMESSIPLTWLARYRNLTAAANAYEAIKP